MNVKILLRLYYFFSSITGSIASSYLGPGSGNPNFSMKSKTNRLEVGVDVHPRKKFSFSSERLSETVSLSERSATVSLVDDGGNSVASTRALAGSLLAYKVYAVTETFEFLTRNDISRKIHILIFVLVFY